MNPESVAEMFPEPGPVTVRELADQYLRLGTEEICPKTLENKKHVLKLFVAVFGDRLVTSLKMLEISAWLTEQNQWKAWSKRGAIANVKAMFNWGVKWEVIEKNPARNVTKPAGDRRRSTTVTEFRAILRGSPNARFRQFIFMLQRTGMRFSEVADLKWENVDFKNRQIVLVHHKTKRVTMQDRVVPLTRVTEALLRYLHRNTPSGLAERLRAFCSVPRSATEIHEWIAPHSIREVIVKVAIKMAGITIGRDGTALNRWLYGATSPPLAPGAPWLYEVSKSKSDDAGRYFDYVFRNLNNKPWSRNGFFHYMKDMRRRGIIPRDCRIHGLRHLFVSTAIERGIPIRIVGALAGHRDVRTTEIYNHVDENIDLLREAMEKAHARAPVPKPPRQVGRRLSALVGTAG